MFSSPEYDKVDKKLVNHAAALGYRVDPDTITTKLVGNEMVRVGTWTRLTPKNKVGRGARFRAHKRQIKARMEG